MITAQELRSVTLFAALPDNEAETLAARVADVRLREGDWLIHEGEQPSFFLLIEGSVEVRKVVRGTEQRITEFHQGEYFGELPLLLGSPAIVSLRALEPTRVAQLDHGDFAQLFTSCSTLASELLRTMTERITRLQALATQAAPASVAIVGHRYDIACHQLRDFLARNRITFRWLDPTRPGTSGEIEVPRPGDRFPVIVLPDGERLVTPTLRELAQKLGLQTAPGSAAYDLAIIGAGPAGLAAAVYGAARTEAMNCQGQQVFLVGGGNSAGQAAMFFANYARKVSLLVRGSSLADSMSHYLILQLASKSNIEVCTRCRIVRVEGERRLESIVVEHRDTGELVTEPASAVFAFIGADAQTSWLPPSMIRDENGYVCTGRDVMALV